MPTKNAKRSTSFIRLLLAGRCSQRHPCTGAQNGANSPLGFRLQTRPKRRKSLPGARRRRGSLALSLAGRSTMVYRKGQPRRKGTGRRCRVRDWYLGAIHLDSHCHRGGWRWWIWLRWGVYIYADYANLPQVRAEGERPKEAA